VRLFTHRKAISFRFFWSSWLWWENLRERKDPCVLT